MQEHRLETARSARFFTLGPPAEHPADFWIVCHGYGQLARDFLSGFEPLAAPGVLIAAPEALSRFYTASPDARQPGARVGASWMTREDRVAEIEDQVKYLDALAGRLVGASGPGRIRALGFSQGGSVVCRWAALGSTPLAALVVWAGEIPADLPDEVIADRFGRLAIHLVAGTRDKLVPEALVEHQVSRLRGAGIEPRVHRFDGGHRLDAGVLRELSGTD